MVVFGITKHKCGVTLLCDAQTCPHFPHTENWPFRCTSGASRPILSLFLLVAHFSCPSARRCLFLACAPRSFSSRHAREPHHLRHVFFGMRVWNAVTE